MVDTMKSKGRGLWRWMRLNPVMAAVAVLVLAGAGATGVITATPLASGAASLAVFGYPGPVPVTAAALGTVTVTHASSATVAVGEAFSDTAQVSSSTSAPTGSVLFSLCGPMAADATCTPVGTNTVGTGPVALTPGPTDTSSATSATVTETTVGVYCFAAVYTPGTGSGYAGSNDNVFAPTDADECVDVAEPGLSVVKDSIPAPGSHVAPNTLVTYTFTLTNTGNALVSGVTVTDHVPTGTSYVAGSANCGSDTTCSASETAGTVTWSGVDVAPETGTTPGTLTLSFDVTVAPTDTNGQVISNVASFTNDGTPNCTTATCATNTVTLIVVVPVTKAVVVVSHPAPPTPVVKAVTSPPLAPVPSVTTVHTGKPWAGSRPFEAAGLGLGLLLIGLGERQRRRQRKAARRPA